MRRPVLLIFTNACILIVVFVLLAQSLFIVQRIALAREVSGQVTLQRGGAGAWVPLAAGMGVKSGDIVQTGARSAAEFAWQDGTRWRLGPSSRLAIEKSLLNPTKKNEISRFHLDSGQVLVRVVRPMSPDSRFEIETPGALASVRGTVFQVAVKGSGTEVKVFQGSVEVTQNGGAKSVRIAPGQKASVSPLGLKTGADTNQSDFLAQPTFLRPELSVQARLLPDRVALLTGQTEVGDRLTIDGAPVTVLGTGAFLKRVPITPNSTGWKIESLDKHGMRTITWQRLPLAAEN